MNGDLPTAAIDPKVPFATNEYEPLRHSFPNPLGNGSRRSVRFADFQTGLTELERKERSVALLNVPARLSINRSERLFGYLREDFRILHRNLRETNSDIALTRGLLLK
jgi:hypothetical protein